MKNINWRAVVRDWTIAIAATGAVLLLSGWTDKDSHTVDVSPTTILYEPPL